MSANKGEESIHKFSSLEVINSEIFVSQSDVLCESNKHLNYDASDIGDKTCLNLFKNVHKFL